MALRREITVIGPVMMMIMMVLVMMIMRVMMLVTEMIGEVKTRRKLHGVIRRRRGAGSADRRGRRSGR